jgi:cold-inducible RNA-binding protein
LFVSKKLYVGNLPYSTTDQELQTLFEEAGEVASATIIIDRENNRSKGFGFVEMKTEEGAKEGIRRFNGYQLQNRSLTVNEALPRVPRERSGGGFNSGERGFGGGSRGGYSDRGDGGGYRGGERGDRGDRDGRDRRDRRNY